MRVRAALAGIFLFASTGDAPACGLEEIVAGLCPDAFDLLDEAGSGDRAALVKKFAWTKLKGVNSTGPIELRICAFVAPSAVVSEAGKKIEKLDFSKARKTWEALMEQVESQALEWNIPQKSALGGMRTSRLTFIFRQTSGEFRTCEDFPKSHIRIAFVKNANFSVYGTQSWTYRLNGAGEVQASMVLQPAAVERAQGTVQHEFGHALGFIHEMHHPRWRECATDFDLRPLPRGSSEALFIGKDAREMAEMARENLLGSEFSEKELASTYEFDTRSIMSYVIAAKYFTEKTCAFPNDIAVISPGDYSKCLDVYAQ